MAKTSKGTTTTPQDEARKQRKKQARQEAKLMLKLEQSRKGVQKAERKLTKAQSNLETSNAQLHTLENKLTQMRSSNQEARNGSSQQEVQPDEHETLTVFASEDVAPLTQVEMSSVATGEQTGSMDQQWSPTEPTNDSSPAETEDKSVPSSEQKAESSNARRATTRSRRQRQQSTQNKEDQ